MLRVERIIGACAVTAALAAVTSLAMPARAGAAVQAPAAAAAPVVNSPAASAKNPPWAKKKVVSPYARAASQREHAGEAPFGHAPTMVQSMGKPRKPHTGAPHK
jgi:hypothetical protein